MLDVQLDRLRERAEQLRLRIAQRRTARQLERARNKKAVVQSVVVLLLASLIIGAAVHVRGGNLEVHSVTATAGSDSNMIKIWGETSAGQKEMTLQNIAESGSDNYRLGILNAGATTEIVTVDDDGLVGIMNTSPANALDVRGDVNIVSGGLTGCTSYAELDTEATTTSGTFADRATLTLGASATYLIWASCENWNSHSQGGTEVQLYNKSTTTILGGPLRDFHYDGSDYSSTHFWIKRVIVDGSADTVAIQYRRTAGTAYIRNTRIFALRIE